MTHVGSLPRSNELSDLLFKKDKGERGTKFALFLSKSYFVRVHFN